MVKEEEKEEEEEDRGRKMDYTMTKRTVQMIMELTYWFFGLFWSVERSGCDASRGFGCGTSSSLKI